MPAGVSWTSYLKMFAASLLAMCAGAEVVHRYYRPDLVSAGESLRLASGPLHFHSGKVQFSRSVMSNSATPWTSAFSLPECPITNSRNLLKLMSIKW